MQSNYIHTSDQLPMVIGVDLGGTQFRTAVLHGSNLLSRVSSLTGENPSPERIIPRIFTAVQQALEPSRHYAKSDSGHWCCRPWPIGSRNRRYFRSAQSTRLEGAYLYAISSQNVFTSPFSLKMMRIARAWANICLEQDVGATT